MDKRIFSPKIKSYLLNTFGNAKDGEWLSITIGEIKQHCYDIAEIFYNSKKGQADKKSEK